MPEHTRQGLTGLNGVRIADGPVFFDLAVAGAFAAIAAWRDHRTRDLRMIRRGVVHALEWAAARRFEIVHIPLIGAGHTRHFHPRFSLVEIIRGFREWRNSETGREPRLRLIIHVVDNAVIRTLNAGSLDVPELLAADDLRFWIEIIDGDRLERELLFRFETDLVSAVAEEYGVSAEGWIVETDPMALAEGLDAYDLSGASLRRLGVLPGATLRFRRRDKAYRPIAAATPYSGVSTRKGSAERGTRG